MPLITVCYILTAKITKKHKCFFCLSRSNKNRCLNVMTTDLFLPVSPYILRNINIRSHRKGCIQIWICSCSLSIEWFILQINFFRFWIYFLFYGFYEHTFQLIHITFKAELSKFRSIFIWMVRCTADRPEVIKNQKSQKQNACFH